MSFKENPCQQLSISDSFYGLTARERKALEKSWANFRKLFGFRKGSGNYASNPLLA